MAYGCYSWLLNCIFFCLVRGRQGHGVYEHRDPTVHGLWPETGNYGNSPCVKPKDNRGPEHFKRMASTASCFPDKWLAKHEWKAHGKCAGTKNALEYFQQICDLAEDALRLMKQVLASKKVHHVNGLAGMVSELKHAGMHVWYADTRESQLFLSVCAGKDGEWQLAPAASNYDEPDFEAVCYDPDTETHAR